MSFLGKPSNPEPIGKTEPVGAWVNNGQGMGQGMGQGQIRNTEPLNSWSGSNVVNAVGRTVPIDPAKVAGIVEIPEIGNKTVPGNEPKIEPVGQTIPANNFIDVNTNFTGEKPVTAPVVGWLVCIEGPDYGRDYRIHSDYNYVGRQEGDIIISGDPKISSRNHMRISFEPNKRVFSVSTFEGRNFIYVNDEALDGAVKIKEYDVISTGDTKLMLKSFCGEQFIWDYLKK